MRGFAGVAVLLLVACGSTAVLPPPAAEDRLEAAGAAAANLAHEAIAAKAYPSAAWALVDERSTTHGAAGLADPQRGIAATPDTPYPLASTTKPIVATALMLLAGRNAIQLDAPLLPQLDRAPGQSGYTVRQVLAHTAGLPTYARIYWKDQAVPMRPLMENFQRYGIGAQPPGAVFEYSNLGYGLLGELIAKRSGMPLPQFLHDEVFAPLGMQHAVLAEGFAAPDGAARKCAADGNVLPDSANDTPGAGNVYASATDLAKFAAFSLGIEHPGIKPILGPEQRRAMQQPADPAALHPYYGGAGYGLGWYVRQVGTERVVWHEGGMPGASSIIVLLPERKLGAVALINAADVNTKAQELANALLRAAAPDLPPLSFVATEGFARYADEPALLGQWTGHLRIDGKRLPWSVVFGRDGKVTATFPDRASKASAPQSAYAMLVSGPLLVATFPGTLPGRDVAASPGFVLLRLVRRGDTLAGMAIAYSAEQRLEHLYPFEARLARR
jgi:CubicO group peptidase (beta-lactamase class C family)